jgi:hypothetical protein
VSAVTIFTQALPFDLELRSLRAICGPLKTARRSDLRSVFVNEEHLASRRADRMSAWEPFQQRRNGVGAVESATPKASILGMGFGASRCANCARCMRGCVRRAPELMPVDAFARAVRHEPERAKCALTHRLRRCRARVALRAARGYRIGDRGSALSAKRAHPL